MSTPDRLFLAGCMVAAGGLTGCALRPPAADHSTPARTATSQAPAASTASPDVDTLLPVSRADLTTAISRSAQATATYLTYRYDETPAAHLARLRPLLTDELYGALARAAATPGIRAQRTRDQEIATAHATPTRIRAIGPNSVILIITAVRDSTVGHRQQADKLAVTAVKNNDGTWSVSDIEPAAAGDTGDTPNAREP